MKKILIAIAFITTQLSIYAQEPMGGGDFGGSRPPMGSFNPMDDQDDDATEVLKFPEIPGLTNKQREKIINEVVKEHDAVAKLDQQKRALFAKRAANGVAPADKRPDALSGGYRGRPEDSTQGNTPPESMPQNPSGDQRKGKRPDRPQMEEQPLPPVLSESDKKKLDKIDLKIQKAHADADKKCRSVLPQELYLVFKEKKKEIVFNDSNKEASKSQRGNRQQGPNRNGGGNPPDMPMGGGGNF